MGSTTHHFQLLLIPQGQDPAEAVVPVSNHEEMGAASKLWSPKKTQLRRILFLETSDQTKERDPVAEGSDAIATKRNNSHRILGLSPPPSVWTIFKKSNARAIYSALKAPNKLKLVLFVSTATRIIEIEVVVA